MLIGFNRNAPKLALDPDYSAERQTTEEALADDAGEVRDISPHWATAVETSARLAEVARGRESGGIAR